MPARKIGLPTPKIAELNNKAISTSREQEAPLSQQFTALWEQEHTYNTHSQSHLQ